MGTELHLKLIKREKKKKRENKRGSLEIIATRESTRRDSVFFFKIFSFSFFGFVKNLQLLVAMRAGSGKE